MKYYLFIFILIVSVLHADDDSWQVFDDTQLTNIHITIPESHLEWIYSHVESDSLHLVSVHFQNFYIDEIIDSVGFRLRGNTSRQAQKKSFKLSFNTFVPGREFYDLDKINLNGEHNDPSIARSKICWDFYQNIGMKASRASYAKVYINNEYYGLYANVEHIDEEFINKNFEDDSGNLWKCLYPARLNYISDNPEDYKYEEWGRRIYDLKTNKDEDDYSQLARLIDVINNTPQSSMKDSLESILDITSILNYMAMNVLTGSWDDYWYGKNNYYIYHDPSIDKFSIIPYDYDNTFGIDWANINWSTRNIYQFAHPDASRPLVDVFLDIPEYRNFYTHIVEYYSDNIISLDNSEDYIDNIKEFITDAAEEDIYRTLDYNFNINDFHNSYSVEPYSYMHVKKGLKQYISERTQSIENQIDWIDSSPVIYKIRTSNKNPQPDENIEIDIAAFSHLGINDVTAILNQDGETTNYNMVFSPIAGSNLIEDSDRWVVTIPSLGEFSSASISFVVNYGSNQNFEEDQIVEIQTGGPSTNPLIINEFLAKNENTNSDDFNEYDDWVELYNNSQNPLALSGLYLTDNSEIPQKWAIPNTFIQPFSYLLIWTDNDTEQGNYHANFKLDGNGEFIGLYDSVANSYIDSLTFDEQSTDISYGRLSNEIEIWDFMNPTPNGANTELSNENQIIEPLTKINVYPNPILNSTSKSNSINIEFSMNEKSKVSIQLFNIKGQLKHNLFDRVFEKGNHSLNYKFNNSKMSSGIYFLKVSSGEKALMKKIVFLKT